MTFISVDYLIPRANHILVRDIHMIFYSHVIKHHILALGMIIIILVYINQAIMHIHGLILTIAQSAHSIDYLGESYTRS